MEEKAKVSISFTKGELEITGSETFVKEQLDRFKDLINLKLSAVPATSAIPQSSKSMIKPSEDKVQQLPSNKENSYPKVIALEDGQIRLLQISGKRRPEKIINVALLCLLAKFFTGDKIASFKEIRDVCKIHACLDEANFAKILKKDKRLFIINGSGKNQTASLTQPGFTAAKELAEKINAQ